METAAVPFIVSISDVSHPRRCCTSDYNEHVYGMCRQILREFNTEKIVRIVDKKHLKMKYIFENDLLASRPTSAFKG